jgi:hypothetical protein
MKDKELMQQALDALEYAAEQVFCENDDDLIGRAISPLRERLAQPRQWQGLTGEEVGALTVFDGLHHVEVLVLADFIRAIEAAIKEKNK